MNTEYINKYDDPSDIIFGIEQIESAEMDEMWSYYHDKKHQVWLWHAIDHNTGEILAYTFGTQEDKVLKELMELLLEYNISKFYTDGNTSYDRVITPDELNLDEEEIAEAHEIGKENTQRIERIHLSLRTWVKRLARKTICFSKTLKMHKIVVGLCINVKFFGRPIPA